MKILHITYIYPPKASVADGITNVAYAITNELVQKGNQVTVFTSDMLDLHGDCSIKSQKRIVNGVNVYYLRSLYHNRTIILTPGLFFILNKSIKNFNIIHIHDCRSFQGVLAYFFARLKKVPYVFQPHGSYLSSIVDVPTKAIAKLALDKLISSKIVQDASKIITLNEAEAQQYRLLGIPKQKIEIVPNGLNLSSYENLPVAGKFREHYEINKKSKILLYLGRINQIKGLDTLVKAFDSVTKKIADVLLVMAGPDDGFLAELQVLVKNLELDKKVLFVGPLYNNKKLEAYVDADIFVLPSVYEAFPMSLLEAYACAKPVVVSKVGGLKSLVIPGKTGLLFNSGDISQLSSLLISLLTDSNSANKMGKNGRKFMQQNFEIGITTRCLQSVYERVIAEQFGGSE